MAQGARTALSEHAQPHGAATVNGLRLPGLHSETSRTRNQPVGSKAASAGKKADFAKRSACSG
jgi:hypothetical protein